MATINQTIHTDEGTRLLRFLAVGAVGTLVDYSLLTGLKLLGLPTLLANSLSFFAGLCNNFILNRHWTFSDHIQSAWGRQLLQFGLVSLVGLIINNVIVISLEDPLGTFIGLPQMGYLPAKIIATGMVVFWNYIANRAWTFR